MEYINSYTFSDIINFCDVDTQFVMHVINKTFNNVKITYEIGNGVVVPINLNDILFLRRFEIGVVNNSWRLVNDAIKHGINSWTLGATFASLFGRIDMVKFFMDKGIDDYEEVMFAACYHGQYDIVKLLITNKDACNEKTYGFSVACGVGDIDIAKLLFEPNKSDLRWAFENACVGGHSNIINYLIKECLFHYDDGTLNCGLVFGCMDNNTEIIKLMIELGATYCCFCELSTKKHLEKMKK